MQRGPKTVLRVPRYHKVNPSACPQGTDGRAEMPLSSRKELIQVEAQSMRKVRVWFVLMSVLLEALALVRISPVPEAMLVWREPCQSSVGSRGNEKESRH